MVQRKAPQKLNSQPETKINHVKLERQPSSHQKEDTGSKGVDDLKKKMKLERSMRAAIDLPNYMKPTRSWDKKKEQVQVQVTTLQPSNWKNLKKLRPLVKKSLKGVVLNRPTCSSTLKDSKFPKALDLNHGETEAEGTSAVKVCPYAYCSLNGHRHDDLPPLKCFVSAKRKLIKTQKSMKLKTFSSFRIKGLGKNKEENDTGQKGCFEISYDDMFVEIYTSMPEEHITKEMKTQREDRGEDDQMKEDSSKAVVDDDQESSEFAIEEIDAMVSFLEYVEGDQQVENQEVEKTTAEEYDEPQDEFHVVVELRKDGENQASILDFEGKEEIENSFPDNATECSDVVEDNGVLNRDVNQEVEEEGVDALSPHEELSTEPTIVHECIADGGTLEGNIEEEELCRVDLSDQIFNAQDLDSSEENNQGEASFQVSDEVVSGQPEQNDLEEQSNVLNESIKEEENENEVEDTGCLPIVHLFDAVQINEEEENDHTEDQEHTQEFECSDENDDATISRLKARLRITGKKITDESDAIREFNPRSPRFLDIEPDPEAETVDLKHQMMDERKNSEEWMIDYALQQAVTKLAPARKKKVALLVEAFETVIPLPAYEKPLQLTASGFLNGRYMQACS